MTGSKTQKETIKTNIKYLSDSSLRRRAKPIDCSSPLLTDISQADMTDINKIVKQYAQNGQLPNHSDKPMTFVDDVNRPTFENAHYVMQNAKDQFNLLPKSLQNELQNDYKLFEAWLSDPENATRAEKLGLLKIRSPQKADGVTTPPHPSGDPDFDKTKTV